MGDSKVHRGAYGKPPHVKLIELLLKCPYHEREREKGILVLSLRRGVDRWSIERERVTESIISCGKKWDPPVQVSLGIGAVKLICRGS